MFATVKCYSGFWLLLLLAPSLLDHACAQQHVGDRSVTPQGSGEIDTLNVNTQPVNSTSKRVCAEWERFFFSPQNLRKEGLIRAIDDVVYRAGRFPHTASVGFNAGSTISWGCGGALISDKFVLTAAHCLYHIEWGDAEWVRLGYLGPIKNNTELQVLRIIERIRHPDYKALMKYNDIALLKLERAVTFNHFVKPACLDIRENHPAGEEAVVTGWGLADFNGDDSRSANLLKVELPIVAHSNCANFYNSIPALPHGLDNRTQICAGANGKDACQGDSGGSLVIRRKPLSLHRVIGITSFGEGCGGVVPGVYTKVSSYVSWIEGIVWPDKSA